MTLEQLEKIDNPTLDDFIEYYEGIPDDKWCRGAYIDGIKHCALGHLGCSRNGIERTPLAKKLIRLEHPNTNYYATEITFANDGEDSFIGTGITPKQRVINYLNKLKSRN